MLAELFVLGAQGTTQNGLYIQHRKDACRHAEPRHAFRRSVFGEGELADTDTGNVRERTRHRPDVVELHVSQLHPCDVISLETFRDLDELFGIVVRQRAEHERVEHREERGACTDGDREDQDGRCREPGAVAEGSQAEPEVLEDRVHEWVPPRIERAFPDQRDVPELASGLITGVGWRNTRVDQPLLQRQQVKLQFFLGACVEPPAAEQCDHARTNIDPPLLEDHGVSGSMTRLTASTSRRQLVISRATCLRPRGVSL
jgi:hypothetical protein